MKSYASLAVLKGRLGITTTNHDDDLALALVTATRLVDIYVGDLDVVADDLWTGDADDLDVEATPTSALVAATLAAAVRIYKGADVPFGVAGMSDQGIVAYVRQSMPEVALALTGQAVSWGVG
jgi:hypothetical protein